MHHFKSTPVVWIRFLLLLSVIFLFQGCIEIKEELTVNRDRSGSFAVSVDVASSNKLLDLLSRFTTIPAFAEVEAEASRIVDILNKQEGITNVIFKEGEGAIALLSFSFDNSKDLNKALYVVAGQEMKFFTPKLYKTGRNKFVKKNITGWAKLMMEMEKENMPDEVVFDLIEVTTVLNLPAEVKHVKGDSVKLSADRKSVTTSHILSDILSDDLNTGISIRY